MPRRYNGVAKRKEPLVSGTVHPNDVITLGPGDLIARGDGPPSRGRPTGAIPAHAITPEYTADEVEFLRAVDRYKVDHRRLFPSLTELLRVLRSLGYRKP